MNNIEYIHQPGLFDDIIIDVVDQDPEPEQSIESPYRRARPSPRPPSEFPKYDKDLRIDYRCPLCSYEWSGKPK